MAETTAPTQEQIEQVRTKILETAERLKSDSDFKTAYNADPVGTLVSQGIPESAAHELLTRVGEAAGDDVSGYDYYIDHYVWLNGWLYIQRDRYYDWGVCFRTQYIGPVQ